MGRKLILVMVALLLATAVAFASGCGKEDKAKKSDGVSELKGNLTIAGSTSVQPFSEILAEDFMKQHPEVRISVQGGGSTQGIEAAKSGVADIGASSRELKPEEKGLHEFVIAKDGIAVIVHPKNKVEDLSTQQIRDVFAGRITNWSQLGGDKAPITLITREAGSGTRDGFEHLVMNKEPVSDKAIVANSTGAVRTAVAQDVNAIGYISMASLDQTVKALKIEGVAPSRGTISQGKYPISRPFIYVTASEPQGLAKAFIDFVLSEEGQRILENEGLVKAK